jgi:hypothetical protein
MDARSPGAGRLTVRLGMLAGQLFICFSALLSAAGLVTGVPVRSAARRQHAVGGSQLGATDKPAHRLADCCQFPVAV